MYKTVLSTALLSSLLFAVGDIALVEAPVVEEVSSWNFEFSPYAAMSSISGDSAVISPSALSHVELPFDDILDALEFGTAVHFEALHSSGWGLWIDYNYVSLGGSGSIPIPETARVLKEIDVKQAVFEGYGMYRQQLENGTFDYMAGIRRWNLKLNATLDAPDIHDTKNHWIDFVAGARWTTNLSENWKFYVRGDIGAGDSDFTATAAAGVRYVINEWIDFDLQYKALWVDYETGTAGTLDYFSYDTLTQGPIIGLNFKF
jgi:opacity protein-like surface antigen